MMKVIQAFIERHWSLLEQWYLAWGTDKAGALPGEIVDEVRADLARHFGIPHAPHRKVCMLTCWGRR